MEKATAQSLVIPPYGGKLVNLIVSVDERDGLVQKANTLPSVQLSPRSVCDLELLATRGFSPLDGFMSEADYTHVLEEMRLASGLVFPIPVTLPVEPSPAIRLGQGVALRNAKNELLGV